MAHCCDALQLTPYMCMKKDFNILALLISGPKSLGKYLNGLMRLVIEELLALWEVEVVTYDASRKETFKMHVAVMWTIIDFPGLGQTKDYKAYLICMDDIDGEYGHYRMYYHGV